jgi:hypothetical protein
MEEDGDVDNKRITMAEEGTKMKMMITKVKIISSNSTLYTIYYILPIVLATGCSYREENNIEDTSINNNSNE